jgi:hypothetical protein
MLVGEVEFGAMRVLPAELSADSLNLTQGGLPVRGFFPNVWIIRESAVNAHLLIAPHLIQ